MKRESQVDRSKSITPQTGRRLDRIIIVVLVAALGYFIWERQATDTATETMETIAGAVADAAAETVVEITETNARSIAVLPFVNMSSDAEQEWFADGLTEEILNSLARTPDLLVAARTSSFGFKGSTDPIPTIAATLGVDHVLEGSVRRGGDRLRVTAQLIRANDGFHLWSETYDRSPDDVIAIQEEIAIQIATALETAMDPDALAAMMSAGTNSVPAYNAYLQGLATFSSVNTGDVYKLLDARQAFEKATEIDPEFSSAWYRQYLFWTDQLATSQTASGITELSRDEIRASRFRALDNAIQNENDATSQLKYRAQKALIDLDFRRALSMMDEYSVLRPNDEDAFGNSLTLRRTLGLNEEIHEAVKKRYSNGELTLGFANSSLEALRGENDEEFMRVFAHDAIDKFPDQVFILYQAHRQLLWAGDIDGASQILPKVLNSDLPESNRYLAELRQTCAEQRISDAQSLHKSGLERFADELVIVWLGHEIMGDKEAANRVLDVYDENSDFEILVDYIFYPSFDPTQYPNLMQRIAGQGLERRRVLELPYRCNR